MLDVRSVTVGSIRVEGSVDLATIFELRDKLVAAVDRAIAESVPVLAVDLHAVDVVDPDGLGVLLGAHRRARRGGTRVRLVGVTPQLWQQLLASRLYRVLDVEPPRAEQAVPDPRAGASTVRPGARR